MSADLALYTKERYEDLLNDAAAERRAAALPRQPRRKPFSMLGQLLMRRPMAGAGTVTLSPKQRISLHGAPVDE